MRTTKSLTISLPPAQLRDMERTAKKENRTLSELVRETYRRYQREEEDRQFTVDPIRAQRLLQLEQVVSELRNEASQTGASKLTSRQINAQIEAYRQQKEKKKVKQPLR
jgi:cell wall assembly regulator SMI1